MKMKGLKPFIYIPVSMLVLLMSGLKISASDPWKALQNELAKPEEKVLAGKVKPKTDPWLLLQAIFLPFTEETETAALLNTEARKKVSGYLHGNLKPYSHIIQKAGMMFNIPEEIIGAVIMVESAGNPEAKAKTSSAGGLMQTVAGTFKMAREKLLASGIRIADSPHDPHASIMAGSWYLNRMYDRSKADGKKRTGLRQHLNSWKYPLEYYYAGPENGKKKEDTVIIYAGGRRVVVDKPAYSKKVLKWAKIMKKS